MKTKPRKVAKKYATKDIEKVELPELVRKVLDNNSYLINLKEFAMNNPGSFRSKKFRKIYTKFQRSFAELVSWDLDQRDKIKLLRNIPFRGSFDQLWDNTPDELTEKQWLKLCTKHWGKKFSKLNAKLFFQNKLKANGSN